MKKCSISLCLLLLLVGRVSSQTFSVKDTVEKIMKPMVEENNMVIQKICDSPHAMIITNGAMGKLMKNVIGSYLTDGGDLSLFGSYATLNSGDGNLSINHSFIRYTDNTAKNFVKSFTTVGLNAKISDGFSNIFSNGQFSSGISVTIKQTWLFKSSIFYDSNCVQVSGIVPTVRIGKQKLKMNVIRANSLDKIKVDVTKDVEDYEKKLALLDAADFKAGNEVYPEGLDAATYLDKKRNELRAKYYASLAKKYKKVFTDDQVDAISDDEENLYNAIHTKWVSLQGKIPLYTNKYNVAESFTSKFETETMYPFEIGVQGTLVNQNRKKGTLFLNLAFGIAGKNSVTMDSLKAIAYGDYKGKGGLDTSKLSTSSDEKFYVGAFEKFYVPILRGQATFFPKSFQNDWGYIGGNILLEQEFGKYSSTNLKLGLPIRLNDKDGDPKVNFELQFRTQNIFNNRNPDASFWERSSIGINVGLPFNSLIF